MYEEKKFFFFDIIYKFMYNLIPYNCIFWKA